MSHRSCTFSSVESLRGAIQALSIVKGQNEYPTSKRLYLNIKDNNALVYRAGLECEASTNLAITNCHTDFMGGVDASQLLKGLAFLPGKEPLEMELVDKKMKFSVGAKSFSLENNTELVPLTPLETTLLGKLNIENFKTMIKHTMPFVLDGEVASEGDNGSESLKTVNWYIGDGRQFMLSSNNSAAAQSKVLSNIMTSHEFCVSKAIAGILALVHKDILEIPLFISGDSMLVMELDSIEVAFPLKDVSWPVDKVLNRQGQQGYYQSTVMVADLREAIGMACLTDKFATMIVDHNEIKFVNAGTDYAINATNSPTETPVTVDFNADEVAKFLSAVDSKTVQILVKYDDGVTASLVIMPPAPVGEDKKAITVKVKAEDEQGEYEVEEPMGELFWAMACTPPKPQPKTEATPRKAKKDKEK